jgi:hypothetical protein
MVETAADPEMLGNQHDLGHDGGVDEGESLRCEGQVPLREDQAFVQYEQAEDYVEGTSKNGPVIDLLSMAPDVSWVRRGLVSAISGFLPPDAQVGA